MTTFILNADERIKECLDFFYVTCQHFHLVVLVDVNVSIEKNERKVSTDNNPM